MQITKNLANVVVPTQGIAQISGHSDAVARPPASTQATCNGRLSFQKRADSRSNFKEKVAAKSHEFDRVSGQIIMLGAAKVKGHTGFMRIVKNIKASSLPMDKKEILIRSLEETVVARYREDKKEPLYDLLKRTKDEMTAHSCRKDV